MVQKKLERISDFIINGRFDEKCMDYPDKSDKAFEKFLNSEPTKNNYILKKIIVFVAFIVTTGLILCTYLHFKNGYDHFNWLDSLTERQGSNSTTPISNLLNSVIGSAEENNSIRREKRNILQEYSKPDDRNMMSNITAQYNILSSELTNFYQLVRKLHDTMCNCTTIMESQNNMSLSLKNESFMMNPTSSKNKILIPTFDIRKTENNSSLDSNSFSKTFGIQKLDAPEISFLNGGVKTNISDSQNKHGFENSTSYSTHLLLTDEELHGAKNQASQKTNETVANILNRTSSSSTDESMGSSSALPATPNHNTLSTFNIENVHDGHERRIVGHKNTNSSESIKFITSEMENSKPHSTAHHELYPDEPNTNANLSGKNAADRYNKYLNEFTTDSKQSDELKWSINDPNDDPNIDYDEEEYDRKVEDIERSIKDLSEYVNEPAMTSTKIPSDENTEITDNPPFSLENQTEQNRSTGLVGMAIQFLLDHFLNSNSTTYNTIKNVNVKSSHLEPFDQSVQSSKKVYRKREIGKENYANDVEEANISPRTYTSSKISFVPTLAKEYKPLIPVDSLRKLYQSHMPFTDFLNQYRLRRETDNSDQEDIFSAYSLKNHKILAGYPKIKSKKNEESVRWFGIPILVPVYPIPLDIDHGTTANISDTPIIDLTYKDSGFSENRNFKVNKSSSMIKNVEKNDELNDTQMILSAIQELNVCDDGEVACADNSACIVQSAWCDGILQCDDGSDELKCACKERMDKGKICDGYFDCPNGEDERGCFGCSEDSFSCDDWGRWKPNVTCVQMDKRCDNHFDCINKKDEKDCNLLAETVDSHDTFLVSYAAGYLHRNWKGKWYPACIDSNSDWIKEACQAELGENNVKDISTDLIRFNNNYSGKFVQLTTTPGANVELIDKCERNGYALHVTCPTMMCGNRIPEMDQLVRTYRLKRLVRSYKMALKNGTSNATLPQNFDSTTGHPEDLKKITDLLYHVFSKNSSATKDTELNLDNLSESNEKYRKPREDERVVGGRTSGPGSWPWIIALYKNGIFHCGGVIIDEKWIMTAAHCVHQFQDNYFEVQAGILRRLSFSPMEQTRKVTHVIVHTAYSRADMKNDLALLRVETPLKFNRWVRPICLPAPRPPWGPPSGAICTAVGWGATVEHGPDPDNMREVEVPILSQCKHFADREGDEICAGYLSGGHDTCQGDSGGPLLCRMPLTLDGWYVSGVVSHGEGCARPMEPGAYTRVALYIPWIVKNTDDETLPKRRLPVQECPGLRCKDGGRCIARKRVCDRVVDCLNAEDEMNCVSRQQKLDQDFTQVLEQTMDNDESFKTVQSSEYEIENKTDADVKIELFPFHPNESKSSTTPKINLEPFNYSSINLLTFNDADSFTCNIIFQKIPKSMRCNFEIDCEDGSDEINCTCATHLKLFNFTAICDGTLNCYDFTDEINCTEPSCKNEEFYCYKSQVCIERSWRCDGSVDCPHGEDEHNCYVLTNDLSINYHHFQIPKYSRNGIVAMNKEGSWRPLCIENGSVESNARDVCQHLGFMNYETVEKFGVWNTTLPFNPYNSSLENKNPSYCHGISVTCSPTLDTDQELLPWHSNIYINGLFACPALAVNNRWIVGDRSCCKCYNGTNDYVVAVFGTNKNFFDKIESSYEQIIVVDRVLCDSNTENFIAQLSHNLPETKYTKTLTLPSWYPQPEADTTCLLIGVNSTKEIISYKLQIELKCSQDQRCYRSPVSDFCSKDNIMYSGIVCLSKNKYWYPAAIFQRNLINCDSKDIIRFKSFESSLNKFDFHKTNAPNITSPPGCHGYRCKLGACFSWSRICDGKPDCRSNEDEIEETCIAKNIVCKYQPSQCGCKTHEFQCKNSECVSKTKLCDGIDDCGDRSDEAAFCKNYNCAEYLRITDPSKLCDQFRNCMDKSDENIDSCPNLCAEHTSFHCLKNKICIPADFICDGERDCPDGEDENNCIALRNQNEKNSNEGLLMVQSHGQWQKECISADYTSIDMSVLCKLLGFQKMRNIKYESSFKNSTSSFSLIKLNKNLEVHLRQSKQVNAAEPEICNNVYLECE